MSTDTTRTVLRASQSRPTATLAGHNQTKERCHASGSVIALVRSP